MNATPIEEETPEKDPDAKLFMFAHALMLSFILCTALGFGIMVGVGAGFIAFGVACGIYGYILGDN